MMRASYLLILTSAYTAGLLWRTKVISTGGLAELERGGAGPCVRRIKVPSNRKPDHNVVNTTTVLDCMNHMFTWSSALPARLVGAPGVRN